ncbi:Mpped2 [Symbiodinium sp. CCMP2456]|nr:Mpped2 [Symbiodinium sp. CCMP2456]
MQAVHPSASCKNSPLAAAVETEPSWKTVRLKLQLSEPQPSRATTVAEGLLIGVSGQQRVSGLAVGHGCLFAAMSSGTLRVFALPSLEEQVSVALRVLLPPQSPVIVDWCGLVASRRSLYVVDLRCGSVVREMPLLFAARPCIIAEGASVFVQCDEAIRHTPFSHGSDPALFRSWVVIPPLGGGWVVMALEVSTVADAMAHISRNRWMAIVAALGTRREDMLFDRGKESSLILAAKQLDPPPLFAVFSWTACEKQNVASRCRRAGADAVICSAEGLIDLLVAPAPRVLCLAGEETTVTVQSVARMYNFTVVRVATNAEALDHVRNRGPWGAVIAALGTRPGVDLIFDAADDRSTLISVVKRLQPSPTMVVFSHTACKHGVMSQACMDAGADSVLCTAEDLEKLVAAIEASRASFLLDTSAPDVPPEPIPDIEEEPPGASPFPIYRTTAEYPIVASRVEQNRELERKLGPSHPALKDLKSLLREIEEMLESLPHPLTVTSLSSPLPPVRFVHISDTHHHHKNVFLPPGEVLLHTGDLVGNYGDRDIFKHLADFVDWLFKIESRFKLIVVIAGNHDTLLDEQRYPADAAKAKKPFLESLPRNVVYLENGLVEYQGLKIWGSPTVSCREETLGKRYLSNAFERRRAQRQQIWSKIPEGLDVLMTHAPPHQIRTSECGCELLLERLKQLREPPKFHCFGHDHDFFGVEAKGKTIFINGALEEVRRMDPARAAQLCGWVFDIPRKDTDVWDRSALLRPHAGGTVGKLESQDFWKPHEQMLVGMAVLPGGHFVATACPREIRGWAWPGDRKGSAPYLLWTVSTLPPNVGGTCCEVTSLLWLPSPVTAGRLAVFGECDGSLVICELQLCASFGDAPGLASAFHLPGASQAATAVPPKSGSGELTVWSEAGWFSFFGGQLRASIEESGAMDAISSTCYGPLAALPRFF